MQETWVRSLGQEDPLEKERATHSSILACRIPWTEELGRLQSMGSQESDTTERLHTTTQTRLGKRLIKISPHPIQPLKERNVEGLNNLPRVMCLTIREEMTRNHLF